MFILVFRINLASLYCHDSKDAILALEDGIQTAQPWAIDGWIIDFHKHHQKKYDWFDWFIVFNATFSNISAISWRPALVVKEAGVHRREPPTMGKQLVNFITCGCESSAPFCNLHSCARTHAVLMIGLYELLGNPTT